MTKLRGAAQAPATLVAEVIVAALAEALGLHVPARALIELDQGVPSADRHEELVQLLALSHGKNLGFAFLDGARDVGAADLERMAPAEAARIVWLDGLVGNRDRMITNVNLLFWQDRFWLIDHGATLTFQYDWLRLTEDTPRRATPWRTHALAARAGDLAAWDEQLASRLTREVLAAAAAEVPDEFLQPLL